MKESGVSHIHISLDGSKRVHDKIRGLDGAYDNAVRAVEAAVKAGIDCEVFYTPTQENLSELPFVYETTQRLGVVLNVLRFHLLGRGRENNLTPLTLEQVRELQKYAEERSGIVIDKCYILPDRALNCAICQRGILTIASDGEAYMCPYIQKESMSLGNIKILSLEEINEKRREQPYYYMDRISFAQPCATCEKFELCGGGCRADADDIAGEKFKKDPLCPQERIGT